MKDINTEGDKIKDKILIFGKGQIGNIYMDYFGDKGMECSLSGADITKSAEIKRDIEKYGPSVVINTAAKTNLEWCKENRLEAFEVNTLGADNVAQACDEKGIYFMHFSSGCIFSSKDENEIKTEDDIPNPLSYYSWTKVWSENLIPFRKNNGFEYLILRPRQPISAEVHYKNTLMKYLTFKKFVDTPNTATVIDDLMDWTLLALNKRPTGKLHVANSGWSTPYKIALKIKKYILPDLEPEKIEKAELNELTPSTRVDTVLNIERLKNLGASVENIDKRLDDLVKKLGDNLKSLPKDYVNEQLELTVEQSKTRTVVNDQWKTLVRK